MVSDRQYLGIFAFSGVKLLTMQLDKDPAALMAESLLSGKGDQRAPLERLSALWVISGTCHHRPSMAYLVRVQSHYLHKSLSQYLLSVLSSHPLPMSLLPPAVPTGRCFCPQVSPLSVSPDPTPPAVCSALPCSQLPAEGHCPGTSICLQALKRWSGKP